MAPFRDVRGARARRERRRSTRARLAAMLALLLAIGWRAEAVAQPEGLDEVVGCAAELASLRSLLIAHEGRTVVEERFRGPPLEQPVNVKSVSKSVLAAIVGIAIDEGHLEGADQRVYPFFEHYLGPEPHPGKRRITVGHLLSMRSGLERTSGGNYGSWVRSRNWVRNAIRRPMVREPGRSMMYSTGNSHLLSFILTRATGRSTHAYAHEKLAEPLDVRLPEWRRDPQGIYFGGNQMRLSPRAMLRFGEMFRNDGRHEGKQVVPAEWVRESWKPRGRSPFSGELYGFGWFISSVRGHPLFYAWGYGGQHIFVIPDLALTVVTTSEPRGPRDWEHLRGIRELLSTEVVPAFEDEG